MMRPAQRRERVSMNRLLLLLVVGLAACGPKLPLEVATHEAMIDVLYGAQSGDEVIDQDVGVPPSTAPVPITSPVRLDMPPGPRSVPPPTGGSSDSGGAASSPGPSQPGAVDDEESVVADDRDDDPTELAPGCFAAPFGAAAEEAAPNLVMRGPAEGVYTFRRDGDLKRFPAGSTPSAEDFDEAEGEELSDEVTREIVNVVEQPVEGATPRITYDVIERSPGLVVMTSYRIDSVAFDGGVIPLSLPTDPGVHITRIETQRADLPGDQTAGVAAIGEEGVEVFQPEPPIRIIDLPLEGQNPDQVTTNPPVGSSGVMYGSSRGVDTRTGAEMRLFRYTQQRTEVDVCGKLIQGWQSQVSLDEGRVSEYVVPGTRYFTFEGTFVFAPQAGMVIADDFVVGGPSSVDYGWPEVGPFELRTAATLNSLDPQEPVASQPPQDPGDEPATQPDRPSDDVLAHWSFDLEEDGAQTFRDRVRQFAARVVSLDDPYHPGEIRRDEDQRPDLPGNQASLWFQPAGATPDTHDGGHLNGSGLLVDDLDLGDAAFTVELYARLTRTDALNKYLVFASYGPWHGTSSVADESGGTRGSEPQLEDGVFRIDHYRGDLRAAFHSQDDGTRVWVSSGPGQTPLTDELWHHIAVVYDEPDADQGRIRLYVDGTELAENVGPPRIRVTNSLTLGVDTQWHHPTDSQVNFYSGWLDEVRITGRALPPNEFLGSEPQ